jgi:hypothetical protein
VHHYYVVTIRPRLSKHTSDEIHRVLAAHYGVTREELHFINYDIKYRMGVKARSEIPFVVAS